MKKSKPRVVRTCVKRSASGKCVRKSTKLRTVETTAYRERTVTERVDTTRIYTGRAWYWDRKDKSKPGGPPTSWDFSMEVQGLPNWGVRVKPGDMLRSNATYETKLAASYENMGIAVALLAPDTPDGKPTAPGRQPVPGRARRHEGLRVGRRAGPEKKLCTRRPADARPLQGERQLRRARRQVDGEERASRRARSASPTSSTSPATCRRASMTGVPTGEARLDTLRFTNLEGGGIYHTITSCRFPCLGQTGAAFPLPDGQTSQGPRASTSTRPSSGFGTPGISAPKQALDYELPVTKEEGYKPGETVTYFCRVHPFMRGAFEVTE